MSYVRGRCNGSFSLGSVDVSTIGAGPAITGDDTTALIAQVNRFQDKALRPKFALATGKVPLDVAVVAHGLLLARLTGATVRMADAGTLAELEAVSKSAGDPVGYIQPRVAQVARTLAQYGDSLGLPSAAVGIVSSSKGWSTGQKIALAVGAVGIVALMTRRTTKNRSR